MTQTKTRASHFKGRVFKSAATSALALSALAGGITLSGGEAKAADCKLPFATQSVSYTDLGIDFTDKVDLITGSPVDGTKCTLDLTGIKYPNPQKQFDIDYNPPLTAAVLAALPGAPTADVIEYTINKTGKKDGVPVKVWFDQVSLSWNGVANGTTVEKYVYGSLADFNNSQNPIAYLTNTTGAKVVATLPNQFDHLWIKDVITPGNGSIDNVINHFRDVPGPLPILGASLALGSVRKLRNLTSRLKVHSMA